MVGGDMNLELHSFPSISAFAARIKTQTQLTDTDRLKEITHMKAH